MISYQGRIAVGTTNFLGPTGQFKFALVNATGTVTYWRNSPDGDADGVPDAAVSLPVTKGLYSVLLGDNTNIPNMAAILPSVWTNADVRLRVWFNDGTNGSQLLTPDQRLAPNGYLPSSPLFTGDVGIGTTFPNSRVHVNVQSADAKAGLRVQVDSASRLTVGSNGGTSIGGFNDTPPPNGLYVSGDVGIGTPSPSAKLDVAGTVKATAFAGNGAGLTGITGTSLASNLTFGGTTSGTFSGDGSNLTSLSAANLTGTVQDTLLSANVARRDQPNSLTGNQTLTGNLGIGTATPTLAKLVVNGSVNNNAGIFGSVDPISLQNSFPVVGFNCTYSGSGGIVNIFSGGGASNKYAGLIGMDPATGNFFLDTTTGSLTGNTAVTRTQRLSILNNGNVGIGRTPGSFLLDVNGTIRCIGAVDTTSDARFKTRIEPLSRALETVLRLRGVSYDWRREEFPAMGFSKRRQLGFIAQEVREVLPQVVSEDDDGTLSIGYSAVTPLLVEGMKEMNARHEAAMKQKDAEIADLKKRLESIEKLLGNSAGNTSDTK